MTIAEIEELPALVSCNVARKALRVDYPGLQALIAEGRVRTWTQPGANGDTPRRPKVLTSSLVAFVRGETPETR